MKDMTLEFLNKIEEESRAYAQECHYDSEYTEEFVRNQLQQAVKEMLKNGVVGCVWMNEEK